MIIIETSIFTRRVTQLLSDDEYRELQATLVERPKAGPVIPGSGGIRNYGGAPQDVGSVAALKLSTIGQLNKHAY